MARDSQFLRPFVLLTSDDSSRSSAFQSNAVAGIVHSGSGLKHSPMLRRTKVIDLQESSFRVAKIEAQFQENASKLRAKNIFHSDIEYRAKRKANQHTDRNANHGNVAGLRSVAKLFTEKHLVSSTEISSLYLQKKYEYILMTVKYMDWMIVVGEVGEAFSGGGNLKICPSLKLFCECNCQASFKLLKDAAESHVVQSLCINTIPLPEVFKPGKSCGNQADRLYLVVDSPFLSDDDLLAVYQALYDLKWQEKESKREMDSSNIVDQDSSCSMSQSDFKLLKLMLPSNMISVVEYLMCMSTDPMLRSKYGITRNKAISLRLHMARRLESGRNLVERLENDPTIHALNIVSQLRNLVEKEKIFTSTALSSGNTNRSFKQLHPNEYRQVLEIMQNVARECNGSHKGKTGATPSDDILLVKEDYQDVISGVTGGVLAKMKAVIDNYLSSVFYGKISMFSSISERSLHNMLSEAGISFGKIKRTHTVMRLDQHYAAATLKYFLCLAILYSNSVRYIAVDEKSKLKVNTSKHCGSTVQIVQEAVTVWDHDVNFDTLAKLSLYSFLLIRTNFSQLEEILPGCDPNTIFNSWDRRKHCKEFPGLAAALVHDHNENPETGARNIGDIKEIMDWFPAYFYDTNNELFSTLFMQTDNARGGNDESTRFAACILFLLLDLDALVIGCQSGGHSKLNPAEKVNGALALALSHCRVDLDVENLSYMVVEEKRAAVQAAMDRVVSITNGATCSIGGGYVDVAKGRHTKGKEAGLNGFQFVSEEQKLFLGSTPSERETFTSKEMGVQGSSFHLSREEVTSVYSRALELLESDGDRRVVFQSKHTFTIVKNERNDVCGPVRGPAELHALLSRGMPLAIPSTQPHKQETEPNATPRYADFIEVMELLKTADRGDGGNNDINRYLPSQLMSQHLVDNPQIEEQFALNGTVSTEELVEMQLLMRANKDIIRYDLTQRSAKNRVGAANNKLKSLQEGTGGIKEIVEDYIMGQNSEGKARNKELTAFLKSKGVKNLPDRRALLVQKVYDYLKKSNLIPGVSTLHNVPNVIQLETLLLAEDIAVSSVSDSASSISSSEGILQGRVVKVDDNGWCLYIVIFYFLNKRMPIIDELEKMVKIMLSFIDDYGDRSKTCLGGTLKSFLMEEINTHRFTVSQVSRHPLTNQLYYDKDKGIESMRIDYEDFRFLLLHPKFCYPDLGLLGFVLAFMIKNPICNTNIVLNVGQLAGEIVQLDTNTFANYVRYDPLIVEWDNDYPDAKYTFLSPTSFHGESVLHTIRTNGNHFDLFEPISDLNIGIQPENHGGYTEIDDAVCELHDSLVVEGNFQRAQQCRIDNVLTSKSTEGLVETIPTQPVIWCTLEPCVIGSVVLGRSGNLFGTLGTCVGVPSRRGKFLIEWDSVCGTEQMNDVLRSYFYVQRVSEEG